MAVSFPKPRWEICRSPSGKAWAVFDHERQECVASCHETTLHAATVCAAALNAEHQRWLTDKFYERATAASEAYEAVL